MIYIPSDCRFIRPELVPVQYGGLSRAGDLENGPPKPASEFTIKGGEKVFLEIDGIEVLPIYFSTLQLFPALGTQARIVPIHLFYYLYCCWSEYKQICMRNTTNPDYNRRKSSILNKQLVVGSEAFSDNF